MSSAAAPSTPLALAASARDGFGTTAAAGYERGRPNYPRDAVRIALQCLGVLPPPPGEEGAGELKSAGPSRFAPDAATGRYPAHPIVEIGSGTGKFTRIMYSILEEDSASSSSPLDSSSASSASAASARSAADGSGSAAPRPPPNLICVEPSGMGAALQAEFPSLLHICATADSLPRDLLPADSAGFVVIANSFHWFATDDAVREIVRILRPGGVLGIVWFHWDMDLDDDDDEEEEEGRSKGGIMSPFADAKGDIRKVLIHVLRPYLRAAGTPPYPNAKGSWRVPIERCMAFEEVDGEGEGEEEGEGGKASSAAAVATKDATTRTTRQRRMKIPLTPREACLFTEPQLVAWIQSFSALAREPPDVRQRAGEALISELRDERNAIEWEEGRHGEEERVYFVPMATDIWWSVKMKKTGQ